MVAATEGEELAKGGIRGGEFCKGAGGGADRVHWGAGGGGHGLVHEAGFQGPGAAAAPLSRRHFVDQGELEIILGTKTGDVLPAEVVKFLLGFVFEDDTFGIEAMGTTVAG
ncbi:MAG TPA: hypothetical protein VH598_04040 [Verrucomicrobiae bacterium]|nr:hypothetical protein [Verrucomicrobiae bacterium]